MASVFFGRCLGLVIPVDDLRYLFFGSGFPRQKKKNPNIRHSFQGKTSTCREMAVQEGELGASEADHMGALPPNPSSITREKKYLGARLYPQRVA